MLPEGCDPAVPGDKLYSSVTRKTYRVRPGCTNSLFSLNLAVKINTTYGNFPSLCFLMLFWHLQSKIKSFGSQKYRWVFDLSSLRPFYTSCCVHKCSIIESFFAIYRANGRREYWSLQAVIKVCCQILFMRQEIHQGKCETHILLFTFISYERKHVSDQSMLVFCFCGHTFVVYLRTTEVHNNSIFKELYSFNSRNPTCEISPCLRISNRRYPHSFGVPVRRTPLPNPSPFRNPKSHLWYRYGYFLESPIAIE